jgi:hypothetical protein
MFEWLAIIVAGGTGGLVATSFAAGHDVPFPGQLEGFLTRHGGFEFIAHLLRNAACGALLAFVVWAGVGDDGRTFSNKGIAPSAFATSLMAGLAATATINKTIRDANQKDAMQFGLNTATRLIEGLARGQAGQVAGGQQEQQEEDTRE